ncbi:MAG: M56 family metallopeptidase [Cyanobacteria bacterium J06635_11]
MMHVHMIGAAIVLAFVSRWLSGSVVPNAGHDRCSLFSSVQAGPIGRSWTVRWNSALSAFVVPPLLLFTTAVAIVSMGARSCHVWEGWLSYQIAWLFLIGAAGVWASLMCKVLTMRRELRRHPQRVISSGSVTGMSGAVMEAPIGKVLPGTGIFSAQIGLWSSDLVVSEGLLARLDPEHLAAVLAHESGHDHYRDTFWFFWLGGLRRLTSWLPNSEALWQELLLLREIRADRWAVQWVDPLVLAESLVSVVSEPLMPVESVCAGFSCAAPCSRLSERVDALLAHEDVSRASAELSVSLPFAANMPSKSWMELALAMTPLLTIPLHH